MIKLIRINLLPYRENAREQKKIQFRNMLMVAVLSAVLLTVLLYFILDASIKSRQIRVDYLKNEIKVMDADLVKMNDLIKERKNLLTQRLNLETMQYSRFAMSKLLNDIDLIVPKGIQLTKIEPTKNNQYILYGKSVSDNRVAYLLKSIPSTGLFQINPIMNIIQTKKGVQDFKITIKLMDKFSPNLNTGILPE